MNLAFRIGYVVGRLFLVARLLVECAFALMLRFAIACVLVYVVYTLLGFFGVA